MKDFIVAAYVISAFLSGGLYATFERADLRDKLEKSNQVILDDILDEESYNNREYNSLISYDNELLYNNNSQDCVCECPETKIIREPCVIELSKNFDCETTEQAINRILANENEYSGLIEKLVQRYPDKVVEYLPESKRAELGGYYLKQKTKDGYNKVSDGIKSLLNKTQEKIGEW